MNPYIPIVLLNKEAREKIQRFRVEILSDRLRGDALTMGTVMLRHPDRQLELPTWAECVSNTLGWSLVEDHRVKDTIDFFFFDDHGPIAESDIQQLKEVKEAIDFALFANQPPEHSSYWYRSERQERGMCPIEEEQGKAAAWYESWHTAPPIVDEELSVQTRPANPTPLSTWLEEL